MMSSTAPRQNPRLRSSCDGCSAAKVKCDKKHPSCDRCMNNRLECKYSTSRRNGKPSLQQRMANGRARALAAARPREIASPAQGGIPTGPSAMASNGHMWDPTDFVQSPVSGGFQASAQDELSNGTDAFLEPIPLWPQEDFPLDFQLDNLGTLGLELNSTTTSSTQPDSHPSANTNPQEIHDCEARAVAILRSLQLDARLTSQLNQQTCPTTPESWAKAALDLSPSFDRVIAAIKRALDIWQELMRCACVQCPHLSLLLVSILWKFVFWYRVMAAGSCPLSGADDCVRRVWDEEDPNGLEVRVRPTRVEVGELDLDQEEQTGLRRAILVRELRRAGKVIGEMTGRNWTPSGEEDEAFRAKWEGLGVSKIQDELRETMKKFEQ